MKVKVGSVPVKHPVLPWTCNKDEVAGGGDTKEQDWTLVNRASEDSTGAFASSKSVVGVSCWSKLYVVKGDARLAVWEKQSTWHKKGGPTYHVSQKGPESTRGKDAKKKWSKKEGVEEWNGVRARFSHIIWSTIVPQPIHYMFQ